MNIKKYGLCCFYAFSVMGCGNNQLGAKRDIAEAKQQRFLRKDGQRQLESQRHMNRSSQRILDRAPQWALNGETQWMLHQAYQRMFGEPERMWHRAPQRTCRIGGWHGNLAWLLLLSAAMNLVLVDADATPSPSNSFSSLPSEDMDNNPEGRFAFLATGKEGSVGKEGLDLTLRNLPLLFLDDKIFLGNLPCDQYSESILENFKIITKKEDWPVMPSTNSQSECRNHFVERWNEAIKNRKKIFHFPHSVRNLKSNNLALKVKAVTGNESNKDGSTVDDDYSVNSELVEEIKRENDYDNCAVVQIVNGTTNRYLWEEAICEGEDKECKRMRSPQSWFYEICQRPLTERPDAFLGISAQIQNTLYKMHKDKNLCKDATLYAPLMAMEEAAQAFFRFGRYQQSMLDIRNKAIEINTKSKVCEDKKLRHRRHHHHHHHHHHRRQPDQVDQP